MPLYKTCANGRLYKNKKSIKKGYTGDFQHDIISTNYEKVMHINKNYSC